MSKFDFLKKMGIFSALALTITGCGKFNPEDNYPAEIYGPPEMMEESVIEEDTVGEDTEKEINVITPAPTGEKKNPTDSDNDESEEYIEFEASDNMEQSIYGPPEMFQNK